MSVPRRFSILRRKPGLVDLITPIRPFSEGVETYRLKTDTSPTGAFGTTVMTVPRTGKVDPSLQGPQNVIQPGENVRMIFKPSDWSLSDTDAFWLKLVYVNAANVELVTPTPSAPCLVLPPFSGPGQFGFTATAPVLASFANSIQIDLPRSMENLKVMNNDSTNPLFVAFDGGGPEIKIPAGKEITGFLGTASSLFVRATGGSVEFTTTFTYAFPR